MTSQVGMPDSQTESRSPKRFLRTGPLANGRQQREEPTGLLSTGGWKKPFAVAFLFMLGFKSQGPSSKS